jgi:hypothetical protein
MPRLRMTGCIPPLLQYYFMAWTGKTLPLYRLNKRRTVNKDEVTRSSFAYFSEITSTRLVVVLCDSCVIVNVGGSPSTNVSNALHRRPAIERSMRTAVVCPWTCSVYANSNNNCEHHQGKHETSGRTLGNLDDASWLGRRFISIILQQSTSQIGPYHNLPYC